MTTNKKQEGEGGCVIEGHFRRFNGKKQTKKNRLLCNNTEMTVKMWLHDDDWRRRLLDGLLWSCSRRTKRKKEKKKNKSENTDYSMKGESDVRMTLHEATIS